MLVSDDTRCALTGLAVPDLLMSRVKTVLGFLRRLYGSEQAAEVGPRKLKAVRSSEEAVPSRST